MSILNFFKWFFHSPKKWKSDVVLDLPLETKEFVKEKITRIETEQVLLRNLCKTLTPG
jgi:hypothetical protein